MDSLAVSGIAVVEFPGEKGNPVIWHARQGADLARTEKVDVILAVDGGSVLDEAKGIAAGAVENGDVWDFFTGTKSITNALPIITVLTLPAI